MKNNYVDGFIPVPATNQNKTRRWYLDIRNLSLSQLIELKKELDGYGQSVASLDAYFYKQADSFSQLQYEVRDQKKNYRNYNAYMRVRRRKRR